MRIKRLSRKVGYIVYKTHTLPKPKTDYDQDFYIAANHRSVLYNNFLEEFINAYSGYTVDELFEIWCDPVSELKNLYLKNGIAGCHQTGKHMAERNTGVHSNIQYLSNYFAVPMTNEELCTLFKKHEDTGLFVELKAFTFNIEKSF